MTESTGLDIAPAPNIEAEHTETTTPLEDEISRRADHVIAEGKTGYNWGAVDEVVGASLEEIVGRELKIRCKQARASGRAANVLVESNDKDIDLYMVFCRSPYTTDQFHRAAMDRIRRFPRVKTVTALEKDAAGVWRAKWIIERKGTDLARRIRSIFPLVGDDDIEIVEVDAPTDGVAVGEVKSVDEDIFAGAAQAIAADTTSLGQLPAALRAFADGLGVRLDLTTATDLLAAALGSQILIFAGPSGTGKSTFARLLASFLTVPELARVLDGKRGWASSEDVAGYYSSLSDQYAQTPDTVVLTDIHEASAERVLGDSELSGVPFLTVEEANLSPIEGYLAPVIHGLSAPSTPYFRWPLHGQRLGAADTEEAILLPPTLLIGPWPRVQLTVNVDANSPAPARKVTARAAVVLLDAQGFDPEAEAARLGTVTETSPGTRHPGVLGDPASVRRGLDSARARTLLDGFGSLFAVAMAGSRQSVSARDVERALNYMACFSALAGWDGTPDSISKLASENALLHVVLPTLPPRAFSKALVALDPDDLMSPPGDQNALGGILGPRVQRLRELTEGALLADTIDFWAALS